MLTVEIAWLGARQFEATNIEGVKFRMDVKKRVGGSGDHASPTDHLLAAVGGCSAVDVVDILGKMKQELSELKIVVEGTQVEEFPRHFNHIHVKYILRGSNLERTKVEQAIQLSQEKYCSVRATLSDKCRVTTEIFINS
jgi:putative redox protein